MHLLIPYVPMVNHIDPDFREFSYGDSGKRARKLRSDLNVGNYVFFHATLRSKKHITAYYVVDRVIDTLVASRDRAIVLKYRNPHILECLRRERPRPGEDDVVLFGDPITSNILEKPLPFDQQLAEKLSLNIAFETRRSETQIIGSATRAWRRLTDRDVEVLLDAIDVMNISSCVQLCRSTEEVSQTLERDIEDHIVHLPGAIGANLQVVGRQLMVPSGRIDLLLEDTEGNATVVEVKLGRVGRDAMAQIRRYIRDLQREGRQAAGVIVCEGVLPAYEEELRRQTDIRIMVYGWSLNLQAW